MACESSTLDRRDLGVLRNERAEAPPEHLGANALTQTSPHAGFLDPPLRDVLSRERATVRVQKTKSSHVRDRLQLRLEMGSERLRDDGQERHDADAPSRLRLHRVGDLARLEWRKLALDAEETLDEVHVPPAQRDGLGDPQPTPAQGA